MSELDFEVEKTSFVVSVIDIIEEHIKAEFLFDYEKQKENFQYIYNNLKYLTQSMPIENAEVMKEFFRLKSEFRKYIKDKDKNIDKEFLKVIYIESSKFIKEKIVEIDTKIERIKNGQPENEEEREAYNWSKSNELKQKEIENAYKKKQDKESIDSYKQLSAEVQALRAKSLIEEKEDHLLVKDGMLSTEEMESIISNYPLLEILVSSYSRENSITEDRIIEDRILVRRLFEIARNYYEDDKQKGINELGEINYTKATYLLNENIQKLLKQKQLSFKDIDYIVGNELEKLCEVIAGNSAILTLNNDQIHNSNDFFDLAILGRLEETLKKLADDFTVNDERIKFYRTLTEENDKKFFFENWKLIKWFAGDITYKELLKLLPSKKFLLDLLKDKNLYKLAEKMTISKNELLEMSNEAQENYLKEIKVEDCLDIHLDSTDNPNIKFIATTITIGSDVIFNNVSFNSDNISGTGKTLNIAGLLTIGSGSTLNIFGEGTLTLGSNIVSKNIIENINNNQSVIYKGITPEIILENIIVSKNIIENIDNNQSVTHKGITSEIILDDTIALNLNFTGENIDSDLDITTLGNTDPEI